jgi:anaerobic selenocysteine-containing dehydrogenase
MLFKRFSNVYGTPNFTGCGSQCANATGMAKKYSIGSASPDYENTKCIIQWGNNPSSSGILDWLNEILPAKERGAKLICIDPRSNAMTEMADIHLRPRPGSDGALALSMMNVIISRGLCNASFIEKNTIGFDELKKLAGQYKPEHAETITGIPAQDIIRVSEAFAKNSPACIETGNALELHINGVQTIRAALLLQALTGNIGVKGGSISGGERRTSLADMEMKDHKPFTAKSFSADTHPLLWEERKMTNANLFPEAVLSEKPYPIKALLVIGANPVVTGPNASRQRQAYKKLDLMVVYDFFMTETAKCANLFLPAATYLERDNIKVRNRAMMTPKVIAEQGNSRPEWKLWFDLAKRMGYNNEFPWNTVDECINEYLAPINVTAADLRSNFNGAPLTKKSGDKKDEAQKFETHSGKIEFSSPTLAKAGINPLPAYVDPHEGRANKELRSHYPLLMTSGAKTPYYFHSQFHNLPSLNAKFPAPVVEMSLEDANALGISQDAMVSISSPRGKISAKANIVKGLKKGIVAMCHGWDKANVNELTDNSSLDPISGFPGLKGFFCKVEKA